MFLDTACAFILALLVLLAKQILWPLDRVAWEGGNTTVLVSNLGPRGLQSLSSWICVCQVGSRMCVLLWGGRVKVSPSSGRVKALIGTWFRSHFSSSHVLFQDLSSTLSSGPALPWLWGPWELLGVVAILIFILFVPPARTSVRPHPKSYLYFAPASGSSLPGTCTPVWNTGWRDYSSCWPSVHRGLGTDSPRLENPKKALSDLCALAAAPAPVTVAPGLCLWNGMKASSLGHPRHGQSSPWKYIACQIARAKPKQRWTKQSSQEVFSLGGHAPWLNCLIILPLPSRNHARVEFILVMLEED